jgi:hypothetical protein
MSGGFTPSLKRSDVAISGQASFLASEKVMAKRGGITLDASLVTADADGNKILKAGTFVTPVTATGKYGVYASGATDGRQTPSADVSGYLPEGVNLKDGDVICGVYIECSVLAARVTPAVDATIRAAVKGRITFQ